MSQHRSAIKLVKGMTDQRLEQGVEYTPLIKDYSTAALYILHAGKQLWDANREQDEVIIRILFAPKFGVLKDDFKRCRNNISTAVNRLKNKLISSKPEVVSLLQYGLNYKTLGYRRTGFTNGLNIDLIVMEITFKLNDAIIEQSILMHKIFEE